MSWEEAENAAEDRTVWRNCVARCAGGTGRTNSKVRMPWEPSDVWMAKVKQNGKDI